MGIFIVDIKDIGCDYRGQAMEDDIFYLFLKNANVAWVIFLFMALWPTAPAKTILLSLSHYPAGTLQPRESSRSRPSIVSFI
jgi:hypothetical protein